MLKNSLTGVTFRRVRILLIGFFVAHLLATAVAHAATLPKADVYVLGEVHDNPDAHLGQARLIERIKPKAIVFEMLSPTSAKNLTGVDLTDQGAVDLATRWNNTGWPPLEIYMPLFQVIGTAKIFGGALPRDKVRTAFKSGAAGVFGDRASRFGLDQALSDNELAKRRQLQYLAHCEAMPLEMMGGMVEAQRLRDASFARTVLAALEETGAPVVLIAGNGHARTDWGVPAKLRKAAPGIRVYSVAFIEGETDAPYDSQILVPIAQRSDPCEGLQKK